MLPDVPPVLPLVVQRPYVAPDSAYGAGHRGIDLAATSGQEVRAIAPGRVRFVGTVAGIPVVTIEHPGGVRSTYQPVRGLLPEGASVTAGQVVGIVADSGGHCGGAAGCLHLGVRNASTYLDPTPWLAPAVLKTLRRRPSGAPADRSSAVSPRRRACSAVSWQGMRARGAPGRT